MSGLEEAGRRMRCSEPCVLCVDEVFLEPALDADPRKWILVLLLMGLQLPAEKRMASREEPSTSRDSPSVFPLLMQLKVEHLDVPMHAEEKRVNAEPPSGSHKATVSSPYLSSLRCNDHNRVGSSESEESEVSADGPMSLLSISWSAQRRDGHKIDAPHR